MLHGWYSGCTKAWITDFLTLWVLLVHDCVLRVYDLHKVSSCEPFGGIMWGQDLRITALRAVCAGHARSKKFLQDRDCNKLLLILLVIIAHPFVFK